MKTQPIERALELRETLVKDDKVLVVDFSDTLQGKDTSKVIELMPNVSTGETVFRTKVNVKEIAPFASEKYGVPFFDINGASDEEIEGFIKSREFDFPLWFKKSQGFSMKKILNYNTPFIVQVAGCNFHDGSEVGGCWYCFVDDQSNNGVVGPGKTFLSADDYVDSAVAARTKLKKLYAEKGLDVDMSTIRISGGEPMIVLDWVLKVCRKIKERNLDFILQLDTNLSTGSLVDHFQENGIFEKDILQKLAEFPIRVLTALKGCDEENMQTNIQSMTTIEEQEYSLLKFMQAGLDIYPQMYNPNPKTLEAFLGRMDFLIENFSKRIHLGPLKAYGPTKQRLTCEAKRLDVDAEEFIAKTMEEWDLNYEQSIEIMQGYLSNRYGVDYKELVRSEVQLRLNSPTG